MLNSPMHYMVSGNIRCIYFEKIHLCWYIGKLCSHSRKIAASRSLIPADKGPCVVILDSEEYDQKCSDLLSDSKTYSKLGKRNPPQTTKLSWSKPSRRSKMKVVSTDRI